MKHLEFKEKYKDLILSGKKVATIRKGVRRVNEGDIVYIHSGGKIIGKAVIEKVEVKKAKDFEDSDAKIDGFKNKEELIENLKRHYGEFNENSVFTIIKFKLIEKYENLNPEEIYYGNYSGETIAKLALRNLDLKEKEKRILELYLKYKSIRIVGKILGTRKKVREVLRKAYEKLKEKKII